MMLKSSFLLAGVVFSALLVSGARADSDARMRDLLQLSGVDVTLAGIAEPIKQAPQAQFNLAPGMTQAWNDAVEQNFVGGEMFDETAALVAGKLGEADMDALFAFYRSALGRKVTAIEVAAHNDGQEAVVAGGMEQLSGFASEKDPRVVAYRALLDATKAVESGTALAMTVGYATVSGMISAGGSDAAPSNDELWALISSQRSQIEAAVEAQVFIASAYTYRDLSDAELSAYVAFLQSAPAQVFYREVMLAISGVLSQRAQSFGQDVMVAAGKRKA